MKLALANGTYKTRSLAAAAQECTNWYPETIEDPAGSGKSLKILRKAPGWTQIVNLNAHGGVGRGIWSCESGSGGDRTFVVVGQWLYELNSVFAVVASYDIALNDSQPVQMMGNGNQLGIVSAGQFFISNGGQPVKARFQLNGAVKITAGTAVAWDSGDQFPTYSPSTADPLPTVAYINGSPVAITFTSAIAATLSVALNGGSGFVTRNGFFVYWVSGTVFDPSWAGATITINAIDYVIDQVPSSGFMILKSGGGDPVEVNVAYSVTVSAGATTYSTAGGDLVTAITGAYLDGSFFVQRPRGGTPDLGRQVNFSAVLDGTSWSGLDFFSKEGAPDYIRSIMVDREQLYVFGTEVSEVWQNDLNTGRPVRIQGAVAKEGSACVYAPVSMGGHVYFIGGPPGGVAVAYRLDGFTPVRISTHAIEEAWATDGGIAGAFTYGWWYLEDGHYFWVLARLANSAWVYDATEKSWHERKGWNGSIFLSYAFGAHTYSVGRHLVTEFGSSKVYSLSSVLFDANGADIKCVRALPYIYNEDKRVYVDRLQLAVDTGETTAAEPTVTLEWSADNGHTWSTPQSAGYGAAGEYAKRVFWIAQGSFDTAAIPRISVTGQQDATLIDCNYEGGFGTT